MEYWYLWLIFIVLCVVTALVFKKASGALQQHNSDQKRMFDEIERLKILKAKYQNADVSTAENADADELLWGVCAVLQAKVERAENPNTCFNDFSAPQKTVYTLQFFLEDCKTCLSAFFKANGEPLTGALPLALSEISEEALYALSEKMYAMFDENNEDVSLDKATLDALDAEFRTVFDRDTVLKNSKKYIVANLSEILA